MRAVLLSFLLLITCGNNQAVNKTWRHPEIFGNQDVVRNSLFPCLSVLDLRALACVSMDLAEEIASVLVQRKLEHENAIESIIQEMQLRYAGPLSPLNISSELLMDQFVHGFTARLWMIFVSHATPDHLNEIQWSTLKLISLKLQELLDEYVANYDPLQLWIEIAKCDKKISNRVLFEFMILQRECEHLIVLLGNACDGAKDGLHCDAYSLLCEEKYAVSIYLKLMMQTIGQRAGCPQIVHHHQGSTIKSYWSMPGDLFYAWQNITRFPAPRDLSNLLFYTIFRANVPLIESLIGFMVKVKAYTKIYRLIDESDKSTSTDDDDYYTDIATTNKSNSQSWCSTL